jgi:hypothetical protein
LYLNFRQAFLTNVVSFYEQPIKDSVCFVRANRSKALTNIQAPGELQISVGLLFAHQQIPLGVPQAQYKLSWSVQKLRQLSLHGTNITPIQNSKMQPASSFIFSSVQLYSTCD